MILTFQTSFSNKGIGYFLIKDNIFNQVSGFVGEKKENVIL